MARKHLSSPREIQNITIVSPLMPYVDRPSPATGLAGKFSFQYVAAVALIDGKVSVDSFNDKRRFAVDVEKLLPLIKIRTDTKRKGRFDKMKIDVEVELIDGQICSGTCDGPPGVWGRSANSSEIENKAKDCLQRAFGKARGDEILLQTRGFVDLDAHDLLNFFGLLGATSTS